MRYLEGVGVVEDDELAAYHEVLGEIAAEERQADLYAVLADAQHHRELDEIRAGEDAAEEVLGRRGTDESRMQRAAARIAAQTYVPPISAERDALSAPGMVTGDHNCGPTHPDGLGCMNSSHEMTCGSLASSEIGQGLQDAGTYRQIAARTVLDATGRPVVTSSGQPGTWSDIIESASGQRVRGAADFEQGRPKDPVASIGREDPYAGSMADPNLVQCARDAMGIQPQRTAAEAGRELAARQAVAQMTGWRSSRIVHADYGESTRERAERHHRPAQLQQHDEPLNGSTGSYRAG